MDDEQRDGKEADGAAEVESQKPSRPAATAEAAHNGPGQLYDAFASNEALMERLKLLNYERDFVRKSDSYRVLPRHYFVNGTNPGEQFHTFTSLAVWLINQLGSAHSAMEMPHEFDDPNTTLQSIVDAARDAGIEVDFPPSRLKSGSGPQCIYVLAQLSQLAVERSGKTRLATVVEVVAQRGAEDVADEEGAEEDAQRDDAELTVNQFNDADDEGEDADEDDDVPEAEDEDDVADELGALVDSDVAPILSGGGGQSQPQDSRPAKLKAPLSRFTDHESMQRELQRVIPQLKITIRSTNKDWRMHAEQLGKLEQSLTADFREARPILQEHLDEITKAMERIASREGHLNDQFASLLHAYRLRQNELAEISERYKESSGTLNSRTETLNALNREIEQIKQQIDEQGTQNINGAPILKIKQAIAKLDGHIFKMRVQLVAVEQALLQSQLADRFSMGVDG